LGLAAATFLASAVEFVEAFTIVLTMGLSRSRQAALTGTAAVVLALSAVTAVVVGPDARDRQSVARVFDAFLPRWSLGSA